MTDHADELDAIRRGCICPHGEASLGTLHGVRMGRGTVRLSTTKDCPEHDSCHRWTKAERAKRPEWSNPWCPIHATRNCPEVVIRPADGSGS